MTNTPGDIAARFDHDSDSVREQAGLSLIEVMIGLVVAAVAVLGFLTALSSGHELQRKTTEFGSANRAIMRVHATMRSGDLDTRVADYQATPSETVGNVTVTVDFPESMLTALLGSAVPVGWRYRDTDSDGQVDLDPTATATSSLVPVRVQATWRGGETASTFFVTER